MPYIPPGQRTALDSEIDSLVRALKLVGGTTDPGVLNYAIFTTLKRLFGLPSEVRYVKLHCIAGVLSNVSDEIYRRYAAPYENQKIEENGDIE